MKENSIERDMHLLESYAGMTHKMNDNQGRPKLDQAIEHILRDYKRVLKENEELKANCIPIQKVKEKIRKNEEIIDISNDGDLIHELFQKNKVYEELLESEE